jgi:hypothetical protein
MNNKGFLGAIGDDLPSIIPIVVALLLFFTVFSITLNSYNSKNFVLKKNMNLMSVSRELKGDSLLLGVDQFEKDCEELRLNYHEYNFRAAVYTNEKLKEKADNGEDIISDFKDIQNGQDNFLTETIDGQKKVYYCEYKKQGASELNNKRAKYLTRFYPVAVQKSRIINQNEYVLIDPAVMVLVVWE